MNVSSPKKLNSNEDMCFWRHVKMSLSILSLASFLFVLVSGCSMSEELKRIEKTAAVEDKADASRSSNLTGEQLFVRSCNTCHPAGKDGVGPNLENLAEKYPDDDSLKALIRKGRGVMPAQSKSVITDAELENLIQYLRAL
jgi:mono/diheme cytochrome c family protein